MSRSRKSMDDQEKKIYGLCQDIERAALSTYSASITVGDNAYNSYEDMRRKMIILKNYIDSII